MRDEAFGTRFAHVRMFLGMTQAVAADHFEISTTAWNNYENGRRYPKAELLAALFESGIDLNWLLSGEGEMLLADRGQTAPESEDSNEVIKHRALLFDMVVGMEAQVQDSGLNPTPEQRANMILFMTDLMQDGKMPKMTPRIQRQMLKLVGR